jgi:hypothetical protein
MIIIISGVKGAQKMKAKIISQNHNAQYYRNKETVNTLNVVGMYKGEIENPVTAEFYMGRSNSASVVYCNLWVRSPRGIMDASGKGSAGEGGYHKESAALQDAITSAGIELYGDPYGRGEDKNKKCHIGGVGDTAMREALIAIARAAGFRGKLKVVGG